MYATIQIITSLRTFSRLVLILIQPSSTGAMNGSTGRNMISLKNLYEKNLHEIFPENFIQIILIEIIFIRIMLIEIIFMQIILLRSSSYQSSNVNQGFFI